MSQSPSGGSAIDSLTPAQSAEKREVMRRSAAEALWKFGVASSVGYRSVEECLFGGSGIGLEVFPEVPFVLYRELLRQNEAVVERNLDRGNSRQTGNMQHEPWMLVLVEHRLPTRELADVVDVKLSSGFVHGELAQDPKREGMTWELCHDGSFFRMMSPVQARERLPLRGFAGLHANDGICMLMQHENFRLAFKHRYTDLVGPPAHGWAASICISDVGEPSLFSRGPNMDLPSAFPAIRRIPPFAG